MPIYQNSTVTDRNLEVGNCAIFVHATAGSTAAAAGWVNLGAGMVSTTAYNPGMYDTQAGNAPDPLEGVSRETAQVDFEIIEYDGSAWSVLAGGLASGTSGSFIVGGVTAGSAMTGRGIKLVNVRRLATGSQQTVTRVYNKCFLNGGWSTAHKSDNDGDPIAVTSFSVTAKQFATAGTIYTQTVT